MLSFTLAHASVIQMRRHARPRECPGGGRVVPGGLLRRAHCSPCSAFIGCGASWLVTVALHFSDGVAPVGIAWLAIGMIVYVVYRRTQGLPLTETVTAPRRRWGPAVEVEYRSILMPITADRVTTR